MELNRKAGKPGLNIKTKEGIPYLTFPNIEKLGMVTHGISTRMGGVSKDHLKSMNLSFSRGDVRENVEDNFKRIARTLELPYENMVFSDQVHGIDIKRVRNKDKGKGIVKSLDYQGVDGLITNEPEIPLVTFYADCVPLFFVDPVKKAIGLAHSGWRGTAAGIGRITVEAMTREFGSDPKTLVGGIGPSICKSCYEVSEDVALAFYSSFGKEWHESIIKRKQDAKDKYLLDLWKANEIILEKAGMKKENIRVTDICTCCNSDYLFSHRASGGKRGNIAAFLCIRK